MRRTTRTAASRPPRAEGDDGLVQARVIAGECLGVSARIETVIPITYLHLTIAPGGALEQPLAPELNAMAYCFGGAGEFGSQRTPAGDGQLVCFGDGDEARCCLAQCDRTPAGSAAGRCAARRAGRTLWAVRDEHA